MEYFSHLCIQIVEYFSHLCIQIVEYLYHLCIQIVEYFYHLCIQIVDYFQILFNQNFHIFSWILCYVFVNVLCVVSVVSVVCVVCIWVSDFLKIIIFQPPVQGFEEKNKKSRQVRAVENRSNQIFTGIYLYIHTLTISCAFDHLNHNLNII